MMLLSTQQTWLFTFRAFDGVVEFCPDCQGALERKTCFSEAPKGIGIYAGDTFLHLLGARYRVMTCRRCPYARDSLELP